VRVGEAREIREGRAPHGLGLSHRRSRMAETWPLGDRRLAAESSRSAAWPVGWV